MRWTPSAVVDYYRKKEGTTWVFKGLQERVTTGGTLTKSRDRRVILGDLSTILIRLRCI